MSFGVPNKVAYGIMIGATLLLWGGIAAMLIHQLIKG